MPKLQVTVPEEVARVLSGQAHSLLLGRQQYIRAILCAVAQQAEAERDQQPTIQPADQEREPAR